MPSVQRLPSVVYKKVGPLQRPITYACCSTVRRYVKPVQTSCYAVPPCIFGPAAYLLKYVHLVLRGVNEWEKMTV